MRNPWTGAPGPEDQAWSKWSTRAPPCEAPGDDSRIFMALALEDREARAKSFAALSQSSRKSGASEGKASLHKMQKSVALLAAPLLVAETARVIDWRYFVAGALAAAVSHGYTTPIDVVKTRMQTNPEMYNGSVSTALVRIVAEEGPLFLLQGLTPTAVGYGIEGALKFGIYEVMKPMLASLLPSMGNLHYILASIVAGIVASTVLCPAEDIRIRLVADPHFAPGQGPLAAFLKLIREEGPAASFRGMPAMLAKQVPYTMTKQVSFDILAAMLYANLPSMSKLYPMFLAFAASCLTSVLSCFASHPGDMLLTATFQNSSHLHGKPRSTYQIYNDIMTRYGPRGFFLGIKARMGHVIAIVAPQLVIYDTCKQLLGLPATGSR